MHLQEFIALVHGGKLFVIDGDRVCHLGRPGSARPACGARLVHARQRRSCGLATGRRGGADIAVYRVDARARRARRTEIRTERHVAEHRAHRRVRHPRRAECARREDERHIGGAAVQRRRARGRRTDPALARARDLVVDGRLDMERLDPIGRMAGALYTRARDRFLMPRPPKPAKMRKPPVRAVRPPGPRANLRPRFCRWSRPIRSARARGAAFEPTEGRAAVSGATGFGGCR